MSILKLKKTLFYTITQITIACFLVACTKSADTVIKSTPKPTPVSILSLSAASGPFNTLIQINGTGFDTNVANDKVFFNGKEAVVTAATSTQVTVTVPAGAGTGNVTLAVNGGTPVSGPIFTYQLSYIVSTFAGSGKAGADNGVGIAASFNSPPSISYSSYDGNFYVADLGNYLIRQITPAGVVSTLAGTGSPGTTTVGKVTAVSFSGPTAIAATQNGFLDVTDGNQVKQIELLQPINESYVYFVAGGNIPGGALGNGNTASFNSPYGLAVDAKGKTYVADTGDGFIREISPISPDGGTVIAFAGMGIGKANGPVATASFGYPEGIAFDAAGNMYVADSANNLIRKINTAGSVSTFAGSGATGALDGTGTGASFNNPNGVVVDASGNVYVSDSSNNMIRKITPAGVVTTIAGNGTKGSANGIGTSATFNFPNCVTIDAAGNLYIADQINNLIRKIVIQ